MKRIGVIGLMVALAVCGGCVRWPGVDQHEHQRPAALMEDGE